MEFFSSYFFSFFEHVLFFFTAAKKKMRNMSILSLVSRELDEVLPSINGHRFFPYRKRRTCISFVVQRNVPLSEAMILEKIVTQYSLTIHYLKCIFCNL